MQQDSSSPVVGKWFYRREGSKQGPVTEAELRELLRTGGLRPDTPVWRVGMESWTTAIQCDEFVRQGAAALWSASEEATSGKSRAATLRRMLLAGTLGVLAVLSLATWALARKATARVRGNVTAGGAPVTGGTLIFSPIVNGSKTPGKPGIGEISAAGNFDIRMESAEGSIAPRMRVQYSPPVLPPMSEKEAQTAVPQFHGMVPRPGIVGVVAGENVINVELVVVPAKK